MDKWSILDWKFLVFAIILFFNLNFECDAQIIEKNSTNFHNLLWSKKYHLNRYHTYFFDYWKTIDFEKFFKNLEQDNAYNASMTEDEILDQLDHDPENETTLAKVASLCGRLRNASSPYISDDCFKDLDFVACSLFDFIRTLKKFVKGECNYGHNEKEVQECNEGLKKKLVENMWPIYMFDSFGKLPSGLNRLNLMPLGRYTDCNSIIVPRTTNGGRPFQGNYCRATFRIPMPETSAQISRQCHGQDKLINGFNMLTGPNKKTEISIKHGTNYIIRMQAIVESDAQTCKPSINFARMKWGICAPKSCNTRNMTVLFRYMIFPTKHFCNVTVACKSDSEASRDPFFIGVMFIFACVAAVAFLGTLYDILFYQPAIETLEEEKYRVIKNEEFEPNGANNLVLNMGKSRKEYYDELHWSLKIGLAFSAYSNGKRVLDTDEKPQEFIIIHAIRSLSTIWATVILSNIFIISYIDNPKVIPRFVSSVWFQHINNGSYVSDTFLLLSGFLLCFWFMKQTHDLREITSLNFWGRFYAKRFARFFPAYFVLLLFFLFAWKYMINGPMWTIYFFNACSPLQCMKSVWTNVLFVSNFFVTKTPCLPITQLLTLDVQFHLLAPILLLCFLKLPKLGFAISGLLIAGSCALQAALALKFDLPPSLMATADIYSLDKPLARYYTTVFIKPYTRCSAFIIGLLLAYMVNKRPKLLINLFKKYTKLVWIAALATCILVVYGLNSYTKQKTISTAELVIYSAFGRLGWSVAVAIMIFMCLIDHGGVVQWFLSQPFWAPIGRLSYSAFLVSPLVVLYGYTTARQTLHLTGYNLFYFSIGCTTMTLIVSFAFHLLFEAPLLTLRRLWIQNGNSEYHVVGATEISNGKRQNVRLYEISPRKESAGLLTKALPSSLSETMNKQSDAGDNSGNQMSIGAETSDESVRPKFCENL